MKPHIVQISPCFVDFERETGGVSNVVRQITLKTSENGLRNTVFCGNTELGATKYSPCIEKISDNIVRNVQYQRRHPLLGPRIDLSQCSFSSDEYPVAHIHTCFSQFTESAMSYCISRQIPFIFTPHGKLSPLTLSKYHLIKTMFWRMRSAVLIRHAAKIVISGTSEACIFNKLGITNEIEVVPNGYDEKALRLSDGAKPLINDPYVLFLGYLEKRKQPGFLIELFAQSTLRNTHKLVIAGPDSYGHKKELDQIVSRSHLSDRVVFWGAAYGAEKANLLKHAVCFCLPSKAEGQPVVLSEAIGAGVPVLYSTGCNFPELAKAECGIELAEFEVSVWKDALERICLDPNVNRQMRKSAAETSKKYTWNLVCQRWQNLYEKCVMARTRNSFGLGSGGSFDK